MTRKEAGKGGREGGTGKYVVPVIIAVCLRVAAKTDAAPRPSFFALKH